MQVETVRCSSSISDTLCILLRCSSTRGKERSCDRGQSQEVAIPIWTPKSAFKPVLYLDWIWDNTIQIERFVDKEGLELWAYEHETQLWGPIRTLYYKIKVLVNEVMGLWQHGYNVSVHHIKNHLYPRGMEARQKTCGFSLTDDSASRYTQYHLLYLGLS